MPEPTGAYRAIPDPPFDLPPCPPSEWEIALASGAEVECCASGRCEVCAPGGFGGSRYWSEAGESRGR
jgi:hypothetical protein